MSGQFAVTVVVTAENEHDAQAVVDAAFAANDLVDTPWHGVEVLDLDAPEGFEARRLESENISASDSTPAVLWVAVPKGVEFSTPCLSHGKRGKYWSELASLPEGSLMWDSSWGHKGWEPLDPSKFEASADDADADYLDYQ